MPPTPNDWRVCRNGRDTQQLYVKPCFMPKPSGFGFRVYTFFVWPAGPFASADITPLQVRPEGFLSWSKSQINHKSHPTHG